ncbi:MAG: preprotein translocase subunit SecG [Planctomycetota bacterium]|jgi:preprotein translocase subunit SecG
MAWFWIATVVFIIVSGALVLIILVQRPQGGGLAGAFGGAGGAGTDTVFGGRVGDALTWATVIAFSLYLLLAIGLTKLESRSTATATTTPPSAASPLDEPPPDPVPLTPTPPLGFPDGGDGPE